MARAGKPLISVMTDAAVRRAYSLSEDIAVLVDEYAAFLTEFHGRSVKAGDIIEKLAAKLEKDRLFIEWRKKRPESRQGSEKVKSGASSPVRGSQSSRADAAQEK